MRTHRDGELLAIDPALLRRHDRGAFWFLFGDPPPPNERVGDTAIVHIRGSLEHHKSWYSDSYEAICERVRAAMTGETAVDHAEPDGDEVLVAPALASEPPFTTILCIDSPGGVVAGLDETVRALRSMALEYDTTLIAYVNELAASAAYALCCACDQVVGPPSAIVGSIGVISTMISQARKDEAEGYDVVVLTSGDRKADGHVHMPISKDAVAAERARMLSSADAFYALASEARGLSVKKIKSLQAGIFQGKQAQKLGLMDQVVGFRDLLSTLAPPADDGPKMPKSKAKGNETDRRAVDAA